jgi:hypothetical protein
MNLEWAIYVDLESVGVDGENNIKMNLQEVECGNGLD